MDRLLDTLTQTELLALALEATRRGDSGHSLAYLKEACSRSDASADALFLLGSEYAQVGLMTEALESLERAVALAPENATARFQLGLLHLTSGRPEQAQQVWQPLALMDPSQPQAAYMAAFHKGLTHLIRDEFEDATRCLSEGIALNNDNPALSENMQKVIGEIQALQARQAQGAATLEVAKPAEAARAEPDLQESEGHLFINAYTRGKPH